MGNSNGNGSGNGGGAVLAPMNSSFVDGLAELARKALATEVSHITRERVGDVPFIVIDDGRKMIGTGDMIAAFERTQPSPYRRRGTYKAADVTSFLAWMAAHCGATAPVFGEGAENLARDWAAPKLALVGIGNYSEGDVPEWHDFRARYDFPVTKAWEEWCEDSGEFMPQGKFAEFVEKHLYEFAAPVRGEELSEAVTRMIEALGGSKTVGTPDAMYEVANGVKLTVSEKVEVTLDRSTGESALKFTEEHTGAGGRPVKIPKFFYIRVPIFFGEAETLVGALLRYRNAGGGNVMWSYELFAPDLVVKEAFDKACEVVRKAKRTVFLGTPDSP